MILLKKLAACSNLLGSFALLAGLGLDGVLHNLDSNLVAEESVFSISNPGHVLIASGIAMVVFSSWFYLASQALRQSVSGTTSHRRLVSVGLAISLMLLVLFSMSQAALDSATHQAPMSDAQKSRSEK